MNLFCQHARFMFGSVAMDIIQPLLLHAVEDRLGQKPREVLEYLLKGYTRQVKSEIVLQLTFESLFQLLAQAQEELGGQSWFELFIPKPNDQEDHEKNHGTPKKLALKPEEEPWFDFFGTQAPPDHVKMEPHLPAADEYDPRLFFLMDIFSGMSL